MEQYTNLTDLLNYTYFELYLDTDYYEAWGYRGFRLNNESRFMHLTPEGYEIFHDDLVNNLDNIYIMTDIDDDTGEEFEVYLEYRGALYLGSYYELLFEVL